MFGLLKHLTKKEWVLLLVTLALTVLQVFFDLAIPTQMAEITELLETPGSEIGEILATGGRMLLTALGGLISAILTAFFAARVAASFSANLRARLFVKVEQFSDKEFARFTPASLITRTTNDVLQIQIAAAMFLEVIVKAPLLSLLAILRIAGAGLAWTPATAVGTLLLVLICVLFIGLSMPKFRRMQPLADDLGRITREHLTGLHTVRALGGERFEEARFERTNEALTQTHLYTAHTLSLLNPSIQLVNNVLTLGVYFVGMLLINAAAPAARLGIFSDTVVFLSYTLQIVSAFLLVALSATQLTRAAVSIKRVREVLDTPPTLRSGTRHTGEEGKCGEVQFCNVSYFHEGAEEHVLCDVSFHVKKGETVGVIGASGSGKSALVSLLPRFFDAGAGRVLLDGVDVREYDIGTLRSKVAYVTQEPVLFSSTVRENISMGDGEGDISDAELEALLEAADARALVESLPQKQDTLLRAGGVELSAGEAQRISIARALCGHPEVLILDDSFSFFAAEGEARLRDSLADFCKGMTRILVTQRVASLQGVDRILVLERGRVAGFDTHEALMRSCEVYRAIVRAQEGVSAHG